MTNINELRLLLYKNQYQPVHEAISTSKQTSIDIELLRLVLGIPLVDQQNIEKIQRQHPDEYLWYLCTKNNKHKASEILPTCDLTPEKVYMWEQFLSSNTNEIPSELQPQPGSFWYIPYHKVTQEHSAHLQRIIILHQMLHTRPRTTLDSPMI